MQPTEKSQPTRWESEAKKTRKRLSKREKLALLNSYEARMLSGEERAVIIHKFMKRIGVDSERQVERILAQGREYQSKIERHHNELSTVGLILASNLNGYLETELGTDDPGTGASGTSSSSKVGNVVYGGWLNVIGGVPDALSVEMHKVNRSAASNLLDHLKGEFPELANISDWTELTNDKISKDFVARLTLKANRGNFIGKCPGCLNW